jgi:hypothetical protein
MGYIRKAIQSNFYFIPLFADVRIFGQRLKILRKPSKNVVACE